MAHRVSIVAAAFLFATGRAQAQTPRSTTRDSSGVRIIESVLPPSSAPAFWRTATEPRTIIGDGSTQDQELNRVKAAIRRADGQIIVWNGTPLDLRVYDSSGVFVKRIGRTGAGPGEFRNLALMQSLRADSMLTYDVALRRASVFAPNGGFVRSSTLTARVPGDSAFRLTTLVGMFDDGSFLAQGTRLTEFPHGLSSLPTPLGRMNATLEAGVSVGDYPGDDVLFEPRPNGGVSIQTPMFRRKTAFLIDGNTYYVARNEAFDIRRYDRTGKLVMISRVAAAPYRLTSKDFDWVIDSIVRENPKIDRDLVRTEISHYKTLPAYSAVILDADHNLWVRDYPVPGQYRERWNVFGPDGKFRATAETPLKAQVLEIGSDYVLVMSASVDGLERVMLYRLNKKRD